MKLDHARPSKYQLGIDVYWSQGMLPAATVHADAVRIINYTLSLHANSISLSFPFYTQGPRSSTVYVSKTNSPSPAQIGVFLRLAHEADVRTTVRPLLSEITLIPHHIPRAKIRPRSIAEWFRSYGKIIAPYLQVAQADHASSFIIGAELVSLAHADKRWQALLAADRRIFHRQFLLMQERWYSALCTAARPYRIHGLYWWEVNFTANPADPVPWDRADQFTFMGVPAHHAVTSCFNSWPKGK